MRRQHRYDRDSAVGATDRPELRIPVIAETHAALRSARVLFTTLNRRALLVLDDGRWGGK